MAENRIGSAKIEVEADISSVEPAINKAKKSVESIVPVVDEAGQSAKAAVQEVETELEKLRIKLESVKSQTSSVTSFNAQSWGKAKKSVTPFIQEVESVEEVVKSIRSESDKTTKKMGSGFDGVTTKIEKSTDSIVRFQSKVSAAIGVVTGLTGAIALVTGAFVKFGQSMLERAKEAGRLNDVFLDLTSSIQAFDPKSTISQLDNLSRSYFELSEQISNSGLEIETVLKLQDDLAESYDKARKAQREAGYTETQKDIQGIDKALRSMQESIRSATITDPIEAQNEAFSEQLRQVEELEEKRKELNKSLTFSGRNQTDQSMQIKMIKQALKDNHDEAIKNIRAQEAEKTRLEQERIEKANQKQIEGAIKAADAFGERAQQALTGSTGAVTTMLGTILSELKNISSNQGKR